MKGFFDDSLVVIDRPQQALTPQCGACGLAKKLGGPCDHPKMKIDGKGRKKIMIYGESPGENENKRGFPFIGKAGNLLWETLAEFGVERDDCWIGNALRCFPGAGSKKKIPPLAVEYCRPFFIQDVERLKPEIIIPLGALAVKCVIGWLWREEVGLTSRWDGWRIPSQKLNAWVCPTWHPSYILRTDYGESGNRDDWKGDRENEVRKMLFRRHLKAACKLKGRPWKEVPDYRKQVHVELDVEKAAAEIRGMTKFGAPVAVDFETNMLKPDSANARIVSCAVHPASEMWSNQSYPWHGEAIKATEELIRSKVPKIASHMSFEQRWCIKEFGTAGRNWRWDTMTTAHILDNRPSISGIEFQAFALLGQEPWDEGVSEYLKSNGGANMENRIREVPRERLLLYGGMDALLEWEVAQIQMMRLGAKL